MAPKDYYDSRHEEMMINAMVVMACIIIGLVIVLFSHIRWGG